MSAHEAVRLLTAAELGELLGLSASTVLDRFEAGDLPGYRLFGKRDKHGLPTGPVRFRLSEIEAAIASWHVEHAVPVKRGPWPSRRQPETVA